MSEPKGMYYTPKNILDPKTGSGEFLENSVDIVSNPPYVIPVGEYNPPGMEDEPEPEHDTGAEYLELLVSRLEYYRVALNAALKVIEPWISQEKKLHNGKHGPKWVYPCLSEIIVLLAEMTRDITEYKKELNDE